MITIIETPLNAPAVFIASCIFPFIKISLILLIQYHSWKDISPTIIYHSNNTSVNIFQNNFWICRLANDTAFVSFCSAVFLFLALIQKNEFQRKWEKPQRKSYIILQRTIKSKSNVFQRRNAASSNNILQRVENRHSKLQKNEFAIGYIIHYNLTSAIPVQRSETKNPVVSKSVKFKEPQQSQKKKFKNEVLPQYQSAWPKERH